MFKRRKSHDNEISVKYSADFRRKIGLVFNYVFPILTLVLLVFLIRFMFNGFSVALRVSMDGKTVGYVRSNETYYEAFDKLEQKMMGIEDVYASIKAPVYSMSLIKNTDFSTADELCDKMLEVTCDDLTDAVGVYYGVELIGVSTDEDALKKSLDDFLLKRSSEANEQATIEFCEPITYQYGLYPSVSLISSADFDAKINTPYLVTVKYTSVRNDTYETVAQKYNMEYSEFITLNSDVYTNSSILRIGTELSVKVPKYILDTQYYIYDKYTDRLEHGVIQQADSTHYIGYSSVSSSGVDGLQEVSVKNIIKNGEIVDTVVLSRTTLLEPVAEVITIGTKTTGNVSYLTKYLWPTKTKGFFISAYYGDGRNHKGLDIALSLNSDIYAADDGVVTTAAFDAEGYGHYIIITHLDGYKTVYAHCETLLVKVGDAVSRGDLIAYSGNTGFSSGPHLHFEVRVNGDRVDPAPFLGVSEQDGSIGAIPK